MLPLRCVQLHLRTQYSSSKRLVASSAASINLTENRTLSEEWETAKPFESVPRPSKIQFLLSHFPGGRFYGKGIKEINSQMRRDFGKIFLIPGFFGRNQMLFTFQPEDFEKVFRTEGIYPIRSGFDLIEHYRKVHRKDLYEKGLGLAMEHGPAWGSFRSVVNPVMMNPKTFRRYTPKLNTIVDQFINRVRNIRDPSTMEVPDNFDQILNCLTIETVGVIALDKHLGLVDGSSSNEEAQKFFSCIREFFKLLDELQMKPSLWKYVATPSYKKFLRIMDFLTDMSKQYVEEAKERLQANEAKGISKPESEQSFLERLIKIDPFVANVMAMDTIIAGVDTTTSGLASCLVSIAKNPSKQQKLREEILKVLPDLNTPMTAEKMNNLPYLRACIKESLRLNPVASNSFRTTGQDIVLSGYRIPKGVDVIMASHELLLDEEQYTQAKEFLPERWLRGETAKNEKGCPLKADSPFVFLPFGFGPRMCIGKRIVDLELEVSLAKLVRNFEIAFNYPTEGIFTDTIISVAAKPLKFQFVDIEK